MKKGISGFKLILNRGEKKMNKKKVGWILSIVAIVVVAVFVVVPNFTYESSKELNGFPVPTKAKLIDQGDGVNTYTWSRASGENGIPSDYEKAIKSEGWKKGEREGASVVYTKGKHLIDLTTSTEELDITIYK